MRHFIILLKIFKIRNGKNPSYEMTKPTKWNVDFKKWTKFACHSQKISNLQNDLQRYCDLLQKNLIYKMAAKALQSHGLNILWFELFQELIAKYLGHFVNWIFSENHICSVVCHFVNWTFSANRGYWPKLRFLVTCWPILTNFGQYWPTF